MYLLDRIHRFALEKPEASALGHEVRLLSEQGPYRGEDLRVVVETAQPIGAATLEAAARTHLACFSTVRFHFVERLPRSHMGKVERFELRQSLVAGL